MQHPTNIKHYTSPFWWSLFFVLLGFALSFTYTNSGDTQWLTQEAKRFFSGGHYGKEFVDTNSPIVFLPYQPINWLKECFPSVSLRVISSFYFYIFIFISAYCCQHILSKDSSLPAFLGPLIAILLAVFPMMEVSQRESLMLTFSMPYLINSITKHPKNNYFSACFACFGFLLRTHYFIVPIIIEILLYLRGNTQRKHIALFIGILILYTLYLALGRPDYWHGMIPLAKHYYFRSYGTHPFNHFITMPMTILCLVGTSLSCIIAYRLKAVRFIPLLSGLLVATGVYMLLQQNYVYHPIPIVSYWAIITFLFIYQQTSSKKAYKISLNNVLLSLSILTLLTTSGISLNNFFKANYFVKYYASPIKENHHVRSVLTLTYTPSGSLWELFKDNRINCSRFENLWMLTPFIDNSRKTPLTASDKKLKKQIQQWVLEDINTCHPDLILFSSPIKTDEVNRKSTVSFFQDNAEFRSIAPKYRFLGQSKYLLYFLRKESSP